MLQNYFKIAIRNLIKFRGYALINIFGLAIGIACCLLIVQHIRDELSYDQHHNNLDRLYRIGTTFSDGDRVNSATITPSPLAWHLVENYPEVENAARILVAPNTEQHLVKYEDKSYFEKKGFLADSTFFEVLKFDFVEGDPATAIDKPFQVVISKELSTRLFDGSTAIGKTIKIGDQWGEDEYTVTGVIDPSKFPCHIDGNFYMNMRSGAVGRRWYDLPEWAGNNMFRTYLLLKEGADKSGLEAKFPALIEEKAGEKLKAWGAQKTHFLEPVSDVYLKSGLSMQVGPKGDLSILYIFGAIAAFILFIACINFMNLATAKATIRAQEVGVRKVVGATRRMLTGQFLTEAFLYTGVAVVLAYVLAELALPVFNLISEKELRLDILQDPILFAWLIGLVTVVSLVAGSYPALYLSSFSPVKIFRGKIGDRFSARQVRRVLVVVQFIVSIGLIQGILVIQQQMDFLQKKNLGYNTAAKLVMPMNTTDATQNFSQLKSELLKNPAVKGVGAATSVPGMPNVEDMLVHGEGQPESQTTHAFFCWTDANYLSMMDFELVKGRYFEENRIADTIHSSIINEKLVAHLGYTLDDVIGKRFYWSWDGETHSHEIIGVIKDFHAGSLREEIGNHAFFWVPEEGFRYVVANISTDDLANTVNKLGEDWSAVNPAEPFDHFFLDEKIQQAYLQDKRLAQLIIWFTLLAILISCLGLFGLAAFAAESRTKEIGVRKVLGASVTGIVGLLSKEFLLLVTFALLIATPIAWHFMQNWLQDFHYHIDMPWWVFALAGVLAIIVSFATVGFQSVKAALANPVKSLRSE